MKLFRFRKPAEEKPVAGEIVIIDDTPENLHLLNEILSERGYKVRALPNGQMGLSACRTSPPDLVLLDITMPGMNGYEVAAELKSDSTTKDVPIIFISAMTQTEDKVRAFQAGGVDYVTKPLQVEEVMARVETHLSISRMREQINQANQKLLAWNVQLSQAGSAAHASSEPAIPDAIANRFGKPASDLGEGDRADASLSILAVSSPSDETLAGIEEGLVGRLGGCVVARFSGVVVGVAPCTNDTIAQWLEESFKSAEVTASVSFGEGVLQVVSERSGDAAFRVDFRSPAVLETVSSLMGQMD